MVGRKMTAAYAGGASGARAAARAGFAIVVVDAFRVSVTIALLISKGARVVPVVSIEEAASAEADLRVGERGSAKVAGFDFGNSPTEILDAEIPSSSTVALSTNGTRVLEAAGGASYIFVGSFVNATALVGEISEDHIERVTVVGCDWEEAAPPRMRPPPVPSCGALLFEAPSSMNAPGVSWVRLSRVP